MVTTKIAFYQGNQQFLFNFSAEKITSDGGLLFLYKLLRKSLMVDYFADHIPDHRHPSYAKYSTKQLLMLRTLLLCCGYEDCNDIRHLKHDPALQVLFPDGLPDQSTLSRWENSVNTTSVLRLAYKMIDYYVDGGANAFVNSKNAYVNGAILRNNNIISERITHGDTTYFIIRGDTTGYTIKVKK